MQEAQLIGEISEHTVRDTLATINYPGLTRDLVSFGMVRHVSVCGAQVKVTLALRSADPATPDRLRDEITTRKGPEVSPRPLRVVPMPRLQLSRARQAAPAAAPAPARHGTPDPWADCVRLASVRHVIAVGAGKGGVGKSTVAANLALTLAREGLRVGLLDADIYGPSLPILLGAEDGATRIRMTAEKQIVPIAVHGVPLVSFAFFLGEGSPAIWRGPMVSKAVKQFARGVAWGDLDVLVVDLPPGTGDIPLSLAQAIELSGAVVVTQPPRVAAAEARKAVEMFTTLEVPVLGVVENMTGAFGSGAGAAISDALGIPFLGAIPFDDAIVREGDAGVPTAIARPDSEAAERMRIIAHRIITSLGWRATESTE